MADGCSWRSSGSRFARLIAHRTHGTLLRDGFTALGKCLKDAIVRYGLATAAFLLSAFFILPLEPIFGFEMPSVEHGQYYLMLGIGVVYFLLNAAIELFPVERLLARMHQALSAQSVPGKIGARTE